MKLPDRRRAVLALFVALSTVAASPAPARKTPAIASEVLSDRSRMDEDLRVLCDEVGGRPTGSMAYGASLQWGVDSFRRAKVDSVALESYDAPARWEPVDAEAEVISPVGPFAGVSFGKAPSTAKRSRPRRRRGGGTRADSRGSVRRRAAACVADEAHAFLRDLLPNTRRSREVKAAVFFEEAAGRGVLFTSTRRGICSIAPIS